MPRFFLNLRDGRDLIEDSDGAVFPNLEAARAEALVAAREIVAALIKEGGLIDDQRIEIMDDDRVMRTMVSFREVIRLA